MGSYVVEHKEIRRPSGQAYYTLGANPSFCIHTTEGSTVSGAWSTLAGKFAAPHFIIGENRIVQCRPLNVQGAALRSHNDRFIQVEMVGHSSLALWFPAEASGGPLVALTKYLHDHLGVPLYRPPEWSDKLAGSYWAYDNPRRKDRYALTRRGVYGHLDVPDQSPTWHWDPGSLDYTELFRRVGGTTPPAQEDEMTEEQKEMLREALQKARAAVDAVATLEVGFADYRQGVKDGLDPTIAADETKPAAYRQGFRLARRAITEPTPVAGAPAPAAPHFHRLLAQMTTGAEEAVTA